MNYTYMVKCADGTLYTGWTNCVEKRLKAHNEGKAGAKYTRAKRPVELVYYEGYATKEEAMRHRQKEALISFLGIGNVKLMDVIDKPFEMQTGDMVLLCSDGVTKTLSKDRIKMILKNDAVSMQKKAEILVEAAVRENTHSQDNTSVTLLQYIETKITKER